MRGDGEQRSAHYGKQFHFFPDVTNTDFRTELYPFSYKRRGVGSQPRPRRTQLRGQTVEAAAQLAPRSHNLKVAGSNFTAATKILNKINCLNFLKGLRGLPKLGKGLAQSQVARSEMC
jgi:hypothetical protein